MIQRAHHLLLAASFILLFMTTVVNAEPISEYEMKAAYLYNFAVLTEWPTKNDTELNLCILGKDHFNGELEKLAKKSVNGLRVRLSYVADIQLTGQCNVLFIDGSDNRVSATDLHLLERQPILTVTDNAALFAAGAMIGLFIDSHKLAFDVNYTLAKNARLNISSKLLRVARTVK